jgi:hypothetical protein
LLVSVAGLAVLVGLAGCGTNSGPAASASGSGSAGHAAAAVSGSADPAARQLLAAMQAALATHRSAHLTVSADGARSMSGEGDFSYAGKSPVMQMTMRSPALGSGAMEMRLVDGVVYVAMPPMTAKGKFIALDTKDAHGPMGHLDGFLGNPMAMFDALGAGVTKVVNAGQENVGGETLDHYVLTVDLAKAWRAVARAAPSGPGMHGSGMHGSGMPGMGGPWMGGSDRGGSDRGMPGMGGSHQRGTISLDLWLDGQHLMRRVQVDVPGKGRVTVTADSWGEPVHVTAPPASAVIAMPGSRG